MLFNIQFNFTNFYLLFWLFNYIIIKLLYLQIVIEIIILSIFLFVFEIYGTCLSYFLVVGRQSRISLLPWYLLRLIEDLLMQITLRIGHIKLLDLNVLH